MKAGELKADVGITLIMIVYGIVIVGSSPILAVAAWMIAGLVILRHAYDPFGEFVDDHQLLFLLLMLAILSVAFLLSWAV